MVENMPRVSLMNLAVEYFTRRGYRVKQSKDLQGTRWANEFDLIVYKRKTHPVRIKKWNRTVGVNIVITLDQDSQDATFSSPILIAEKFSEHATAYANRRDIMLLTRSEILRSLR